MELRDYIDQGAKKAGSVSALARQLGLLQQSMNEAKHHRRQLPLDSAVKLADYIEADRIAVIAANELATEKKAEKQAFWRPFAQNAKAASIALVLTSVTFFVTPTPTEAAQVKDMPIRSICIMLSRRYQRYLKQGHLLRAIGILFEGFFEPSKPLRSCGIAQMQGV